MASSAHNGESPPESGVIRLYESGDWWIAEDEQTGVATQGRTRTAALEHLDDAVAVHRDEAGRGPSDAELRAAGIDPADNETGELDPPDELR